MSSKPKRVTANLKTTSSEKLFNKSHGSPIPHVILQSPVVKETKAPTKNNTALLKAIFWVSKQMAVYRVLQLSRAFSNWKEFRPTAELEETASVNDDASETSNHNGFNRRNMSVHQQNYLTLFAENEKLREQLGEMRKSIVSKEKALRNSGAKSVIVIFLRSRLRIKVRELFDRWQTATYKIRKQQTFLLRNVQLEVGMQQVESNLNYIKETEKTNDLLQKNLMCTLFFLKWKTKTSFATLTAERKVFDVQRRQLLNELILLRESVVAANKQEAAILHTALCRGSEMRSSLDSLRNNLAKAVKMHSRHSDVTPAATNTVAVVTATPGGKLSSHNKGIPSENVTSNNKIPHHHHSHSAVPSPRLHLTTDSLVDSHHPAYSKLK